MPVDTASIRDVVVVVPGIMGSELVDDAGHQVWSVSPGGLVRAIRALARRQLDLPAGIGDESPRDGVRATRLIDSLHVVPGLWSPITGYDGLLSFLRSKRFGLVDGVRGDPSAIPNLIAFPYDWRLSNRYNGRQLARVAFDALEQWRRQPGMQDAKLILVCHSMGGLVARWFAEQEQGADVIRAIITIGTPHRGALKALTTIVNGLEPGIGPLRLPLTTFARSLPSMYQLLPQFDCLVTERGRTGLSALPCPHLDPTSLRDAVAFHDAINPSGDLPYALHKVVGIRQPTLTTARVIDDKVVPSYEIDGKNQGGDGTVPRLAAEPEAGRGREVHEVADQHGELQGARSLLDLVDGILTREEIVWQTAPPQAFGVAMADVWSSNDEPVLEVTEMRGRRLSVALQDEAGDVVRDAVPVPPDGVVRLGRLPEGGFRAVVTGQRGATSRVAKAFLVLASETPS